MNNNLVKSIAAGVLLGAALFIMPFFLIRLVVFFLIIGALFRLFGVGVSGGVDGDKAEATAICLPLLIGFAR